MTELLEISTEGALGRIALNRPQAINALNAHMIDGIAAALSAWRDDPSVRAVLLEGNGPRGFCAGGDVRAMRQAVLEGRVAEAHSFFAAEYRMNGQIATYPKPVIALTHGVVMGGGIGLAGHAGFRFATPDARFAMPEAAIGFFGDVGSNAILAKAPLERALAFLMSGETVGAADARALGLTDCIVPHAAIEHLRTGLIGATDADHVETAVVALMQAEGIEPGETPFCDRADRLASAFAQPSAAAIVAAIVADSAGATLAAVLAKRSPTSLAAIHATHMEARRRGKIGAILAVELAMACHLVTQPDFAEGVRAVLVDKDHAPRWQPATLAEVDAQSLIAIAAAASETGAD